MYGPRSRWTSRLRVWTGIQAGMGPLGFVGVDGIIHDTSSPSAANQQRALGVALGALRQPGLPGNLQSRSYGPLCVILMNAAMHHLQNSWSVLGACAKSLGKPVHENGGSSVGPILLPRLQKRINNAGASRTTNIMLASSLYCSYSILCLKWTLKHHCQFFKPMYSESDLWRHHSHHW